ncbi:hypothetical protein K503DRAFT_764689 [Rhizopogon vinicolor AM-OR11-026]|uniref:Defect at low temperature protein 1 n=1 Tax=Rhizopogon vinicolor AM-OR11-026 TaxID=1314800 RepID=A0A1B7NIT1_9AGAM|nr:hypothetical protein K503DRAFT_764689 [Rhizopogon vinicolor AM-OR11-026]
MRKLSLRARTWISEVCYALLVLITACFFALSCVALLSQAARTSPGRSWADNWDAVIIGATYFLVCILSIALCVKRRIAVRRRLQRISKTHQSITQSEVPQPVHEYISQEFARSCLVSYESQPRNTDHSGWGRPGTKLSGIRFRRALLDTIADIDARARVVIPSHPNLKPHARMLHHFRFLLPLMPMDEEGLSELHYYDSAIQLARTADREPTEEEYQRGMGAANSILQILNECRLEMLEESRMRIDRNVKP